ncbi:hypothetical protein [Rhodococcus ruber]|nr:hypothetical protein [Rhodococcus ruber]
MFGDQVLSMIDQQPNLAIDAAEPGHGQIRLAEYAGSRATLARMRFRA